MKKVIEIVNKVVDKMLNRVSCVECGEKIHPAQRLCDDCAAYEEFLIAEQLNIEDFEDALKVVGPVRPDFHKNFGWSEIQDAYTDWAISPACPDLDEVCDRHIPFDRGTPEYAKAARLIEDEIDRQIEMMRESRKEAFWSSTEQEGVAQ